MPRTKALSDEAVLDGVAQVMFRKGPQDFTLAEAAREVGVSPATLIQRFGDKHALIVRAVARDNARFAEILAAPPPARGPETVVAFFSRVSQAFSEAGPFADQLLWLREDVRDPELNALARQRFADLRAAIAARMPPLPIPAEAAARLVEAQWQGALNQWGVEPVGSLADYVAESLRAWFALVLGGTS
jgi:AcrR family transcriptional regulator